MEPTEQRRDPTDHARPLRQPLLQVEGAQAPLRACLLSGGASRRMGRDKALLPHSEGGTWLERTLRLLLALEIPVTLFSRHAHHLQIARSLNPEPSAGNAGIPPSASPGARAALPGPATTASRQRDGRGWTPRITALSEPPPWEGPLLALQRLMERYPDERLLLCPVDMPDLSLAALQVLLAAAAASPTRLPLAHDGERLQPLLGVYPSAAPQRASLTTAVQRGERRLQGWLTTQPIQAVRLDPRAIRNVNHPDHAAPSRGGAARITAGTPPPTAGLQP